MINNHPIVKTESRVFELGAATPRTRRAAVATAAFVVLSGIFATPFANLRLLSMPGYMTAFGSAMVVVNILLAALLFSRGVIEQRGDAIRLGTAYAFVAVIFIPLVASFPGGIIPGSLIGTATSSVWLWSFWHAGFGLSIIRYAWFAAQPTRRPASLKLEVTVVVAAVATMTAISTSFLGFLSCTLADGHTLFSGRSELIPLVLLLIVVTAMGMVCRLRARTLEELWLAVALVATFVDVWLTYCGADRFSLGWYLSKCCSLSTTLVVLIALLHELTQLYTRAAEANILLTSLARQDGLTGLFNRRHFDEIITMECRRSRREVRPISLLMIDVDYFKTYNDTYGHLEGDVCLRRIALLLRTVSQRPGDISARYGGEEFVLLLPGTDAAGALAVAEQVQSALRLLAVSHVGSPIGTVTLSIGLGCTIATSSGDAEGLMSEADRGLYRAKDRGRNQICQVDDVAPPDGESVLARFLRTSQTGTTGTPSSNASS